MDFWVDDNGWVWIPVSYILENTTYSVDFPDGIDWEEIIETKSSDTGFLHLVWSIMNNGWTSAIGWDEGSITEGHHRLVAAILLGEDEVPTTDYGTDDYDLDYNERVCAHSNYDDPQPLYLEEFV